MGEWTNEALGSHLDFRNGKTSPDRSELGAFTVFGSNGAIGRANEANAGADTVIIGRVGTYCGSLHYSNSPCWVTDNAIICTPPKNEGRFWFYALSSLDLNNYRAGSGQPLLNQSILKQISFNVPTAAERIQIGAFVGTLDDKIELNRRMNETLEAMARAIFKDWFVDFGPVRAKAEGRPPYLAPEIWSLFPAALDDEDKPVGWREASIYEFADVIYGAPFASSQFNTQGIGEPLLRIRDLVKESPGVWTNELHPKGYKVRAGDIVVGMDGEFRSYFWGGAAAWLNQRLCVFAPKQGCSAAFVRNSIVEPLAHVEATETATTVIHLGKSDIDRFLLIAPTDKVLAVFNSLCQPLYDRIIVAKRESRTLAQTRDLLLPKLMSGEIRLREAEKAVEAAA